MLGKEQLRDFLARRFKTARMDFALERLQKLGFEPELVFDIGAYQGDFAQMAVTVWPRSAVACFEVQRPPLDRLRRTLADRKVQVFECLLGSRAQPAVPLYLSETASSVLQEQVTPQAQQSTFRMDTIDNVVAREFGGSTPDLIKIDTQGYELEILRGGEKTLQTTQVLIAEINLLDLHLNVPLLHEIVGWLAERNLLAYDICGLTRRPLDQALWQADFVFVHANSVFRGDKRWAP